MLFRFKSFNYKFYLNKIYSSCFYILVLKFNDLKNQYMAIIDLTTF